MSVSRVKYQKQYFPINSYTVDSANNQINIVANNHILYDGLTVALTSNKEYTSFSGPVTVTSANTFVVNCANKLIQSLTNYCVTGYLDGQTGIQQPVTLPRGTGTDAIIQSYVSGDGGANYKINVSLDTEHWIETANVEHNTTDGNTQYTLISPGWAYFSANIISIGANTNLIIMSCE